MTTVNNLVKSSETNNRLQYTCIIMKINVPVQYKYIKVIWLTGSTLGFIVGQQIFSLDKETLTL